MNKIKIIIAVVLTAFALNASAQYSQLGKKNEFMLKMELGYAPFMGNMGQAGEHGYYLSKFHNAAGANIMAGINISQDWFIGAGAGKCQEALAHPNAHFVQCCPKASAMLRPASTAWNEKRFEDTAYFEPFYLKEFIATVPRRKLF